MTSDYVPQKVEQSKNQNGAKKQIISLKLGWKWVAAVLKFFKKMCDEFMFLILQNVDICIGDATHKLNHFTD